MIERYFDATVPTSAETGDLEKIVIDAAADLTNSATEAMEACQFHVYLDKIMTLATETNRYIDQTAPFKLAKDDSQRERLGTILYTCAEAVRLILLYLRPIMPTASETGLAMLGWDTNADAMLSEVGVWGVLACGTKVQKGEPLFPRKD